MQYQMKRGKTARIAGIFLLAYSLTYLLTLLAFGATLPSVFRGVVIVDSQVGVRVVSVEEASQAAFADLRPDDIIMRVQDQEVHSIDDFAILSSHLRGRAVKTPVLIFRGGVPHELTLHLFSYPILREWAVEFVPDYDLRFGEPRVGLDYWTRLGRGFEIAGKDADALNAYLNGLHNVPTDGPTASKVATLFLRVSQQQLRQRRLAEGLIPMQQALTMMQKLFQSPLSDDDLRTIKRELEATLRLLRTAKPKVA